MKYKSLWKVVGIVIFIGLILILVPLFIEREWSYLLRMGGIVMCIMVLVCMLVGEDGGLVVGGFGGIFLGGMYGTRYGELLVSESKYADAIGFVVGVLIGLMIGPFIGMFIGDWFDKKKEAIELKNKKDRGDDE